MKNKPKQKLNRGFAAFKNHADVVRIARMGGEAVSRNTEYMAAIGSIGGTRTQAAKRKAMAAAKRQAKLNSQYL